jgi:hypothetical protein
MTAAAWVAIVFYLLAVFVLWRALVHRVKTKHLIAAAERVGVPFSQAEVAIVYDKANTMHRLVLWLALSFRVVSYDDDGTERVTFNTPTFPKEYPWGEAMPEAQEMERMFHEVLGPPTPKVS